MFMSRVKIFAALIAAASLEAPALAEDAAAAVESTDARVQGAIEFAKALTADATAALTDDTASEAEKLQAFQKILADGLALDTIGKFVLGESRKTMSAEQTARYNSVFKPYITKLYAEQFDEIVGKPLQVVDAKPLGARDVIVRTQFERRDGPPIMVDWRVREQRLGGRKAIDIIVSGVSIMLVKRDEFSSYIDANGVDALLDRLEQEANA